MWDRTDNEIHATGIKNIPEERQIELIPGTPVPFYSTFRIDDGVLVKINLNRSDVNPDDVIDFPNSVKEVRKLACHELKCQAGFRTNPECKKIGYGAFMGSEISYFETSAEEIGRNAFSTCSNLYKVVLTGNIKEIPKQCFAFCDSLTIVKLPASVEVIAEDAFEDCPNHMVISSESEAVKKFIVAHDVKQNNWAPQWEEQDHRTDEVIF